MKKGNRSFGKILMGIVIAFFYLPILYMIIFSFNEGKSLTVFTGFSLRWYQHMLESRDMMEALYTTFSVAILATLISTVVGTISAIGLSKSRKIVRDLMDQVLATASGKKTRTEEKGFREISIFKEGVVL